MKQFNLFNHPIFSVITFLGFLFLTAPITAAEEKVFDANPVVAELEKVPVKLEDLMRSSSLTGTFSSSATTGLASKTFSSAAVIGAVRNRKPKKVMTLKIG